MAENRSFRFGPVALTTTLTTNLLNTNVSALTGPIGITLTQPYVKLQHLRAVNKTASPVTVFLWIGATGANAAGTEFAWQGKSVPANDSVDWYGDVRLDAADFMVGGAGANAALSLEGEGEVGFS